jgi:hypothetical protein
VGGEPREGPEGLKKLDKWAPQVLVVWSRRYRG